MPEKRLTLARLREMARAFDLPLEDEDLKRLAPMVEDLVGEAHRLRSYAPAAYVVELPPERPSE
jgi:hypothetical protein